MDKIHTPAYALSPVTPEEGLRRSPAIPPALFRSIQSPVRLVDKGLKICVLLHQPHDCAETDGNADRTRRSLDRRPRDAASDAFGEGRNPFLGGIGHDDEEFLSAEAAKTIVGAQRLLHPQRDLDQDAVAGRVPVRVVDFLEMVDIAHDDAKATVNPGRPADFLVEFLCDHAAVPNPSQDIARGLHAKFFTFRD